jgi:23S rRNA (uridine2552-2'-O)-methyltransferase
MPNRKDAYWAKARQEGFAARSVFKLQEVDDLHHFLLPGAHVLDLGCAPGSWLQLIADRVGRKGVVVGVDLSPMGITLPPHVTTLQEDVNKIDVSTLPAGLLPLDALVSDLAPHTTGIRSTDQARSFDLTALALRMADRMLRPGGSYLAKTFQGPDTPRLLQAVRARYDKAITIRPKATRKPSFEVYLLGKGFRGAPPGEKDPLQG